MEDAVKQIGGYSLSSKVSDCTTHIVCGGNRRTVKLLLGIARGCWILSIDWVHLYVSINVSRCLARNLMVQGSMLGLQLAGY